MCARVWALYLTCSLTRRLEGYWALENLDSFSGLPSFIGGVESLPDLVSVLYCLPRVLRVDLYFFPHY